MKTRFIPEFLLGVVVILASWAGIAGVGLMLTPGPRELHQAPVEAPGGGGIATSTRSCPLVPDSTREELAPAQVDNTNLAVAYDRQNSPSSSWPTEPVSSFANPKTWVKDDPAYQYCVDQPNGPWRLIPKDATEHEVKTFKYLLKDHLVAYANHRKILMEDAKPLSEIWRAEARTADLDAQEQFARCFQQVWPTARQPDPVVR